MTVKEMIAALRDILGDEDLAYRYQDSALLRYLNDAEDQACRRAYLIMDANTASICAFSVSVSVASYLFHSKILQVKRFAIDSTTVPITQMTRDRMDEQNVGWVSLTGLPEVYIHEANNETIVCPIPQSATMARLIVTRLPLAAFSNGAAETPEVKPQYHNDLLLWALSRAYERMAVTNPRSYQIAQNYESRFTARFGPLPSAKTERLRMSLPKNMSARTREFGT